MRRRRQMDWLSDDFGGRVSFLDRLSIEKTRAERPN